LIIYRRPKRIICANNFGANTQILTQYDQLIKKKAELAREKLGLGDLTIAEAFKDISSGIAGFADSVQQLADVNIDPSTFADAGTGIADGFFNSISAGANKIGEKLGKVTLADAATTLGQILSTAGDVIGGVISGDFIKSGLDVAQGFLEFPKTLIKIFDDFATSLSAIVDELPKIIDDLIQRLPALGAKIAESVAKGIDLIAQKLPDILATLVRSITPIVAAIFEKAIPALINALPALVKTLTDALPGIIRIILGSLPTIIKDIFAAVPDIIKVLADSLPDIIIAIVDSLPDIVAPFVEGLIKAQPEIVNALVQSLLVDGGLERIVKALVAASPRIAIALAQGIARGLAGAFIIGGQTIGSTFLAAVENIGSKMGQDFIAEIQQPFADIGTTFSDMFTISGESFSANIVGAFLVGTANIFAAIAGGFAAGIATLQAGIIGAFNVSLGPLFATIQAAFISVFGGITNAIVSGFSQMFNPLFDTIKSGGNALKDAFQKPVDDLKNFLNNFSFPSIGGAIGGATSGAGGFISSATGGLLASGGIIPQGFPNDTFPAGLTTGEMVLPQDITSGLLGLINNQPQPSSTGDTQLLATLLQQISQKLDRPQTVETQLDLNGQTLANIILELSRNNSRLTA
jgi:hypothetical protein